MDVCYVILAKIFNLSITGSIAVMAVLALRFLLRRAPKQFSYMLWAIVLFRLLCPVSFSSPISLWNLADSSFGESSELKYISTDSSLVNKAETADGSVTKESIPAAEQNMGNHSSRHQSMKQTADAFGEKPIAVWFAVWLLGAGGMACYGILSALRLNRQLKCSIRVRANICLADGIQTPFVFGVLQPRIYLPSGLGEREQHYIILHEQYHILRKDYLFRLAAFAALCLHWFNPFVWLAFSLSEKDMEMSCDEAVMKRVKCDIRSEYARSLLSLAVGRRRITGVPLTFGESNTKSRIKNVMNYRKSGVSILVAAVIVVAIGTVCLVTNPVTADSAKNILFSGGESQNIISGPPKNVLENHYQQLTIEVENAVKETVAYGNPDAELIIESLLEEICSGMPEATSAPQDYIAAHSSEYQQLISYRGFTVSYCVSRFEAGMETGLEGHIMARVLEELLETKGRLPANAGEMANGQEWYDFLKNTAPDILAKYCGLEEEPVVMELGIPVSLPENSSWIQNRVVKQSDERHFEIQYYDSVLAGQCTLWAVKGEEIHLPELGEQDWEEETWGGSDSYGKNVYVDVKYNEKWVLAEWEYQNYRFAILGEVSAQQTDIISVPKVALGVIMELE